MKRVVVAMLLSSLLMVTVGAGSGASAQATASVTVHGVLEHIAVESQDGEGIRYAVRADERTWWLDGVPEPVPASGTEVDITGTPRDEYTLTVGTFRVVSTTGALAVSAAAPASTRTLAIRVYWTARPPANPTTALTKQRLIDDSHAWFREVSHGRYTVSGVVTPWLRIPPPGDCFQSVYTIADQALAAAQRAGYAVSRFGRYIFYEPCSAGGILGYGMIPGTHVWLFGNMAAGTVMHEQGHNLGLPHASSRTCTAQAWGDVTWSSSCGIDEYGDHIDTMGNRRAGHYNAFYKTQLGWLQRGTTVTASRTVTLAPYETTGPGIKAARVVAGGTTYWLEYRTRTGVDRSMEAGTAGVQIRYQGADGLTQLLDAAPGSTIGWEDLEDAHLPAGSSWTSPQRVRFTVTRQTASAATVAIRFGAGAPTAPKPPGRVGVKAMVNAARITWTRPADDGAIIRRYTITRTDNHATRQVTTTGGLTTSYTWQNLSSSRSYAFTVKAVNQAGTSGATRSPAVRPLTDKPSVVFDSPRAGAIVRGIVPVRITATRNAGTGTPISYAEFSVDAKPVTTDFSAPWGPFQWDTRRLKDGRHTLKVIVHDQMARTATVTRSVRVDNPTPTVAITNPVDGTTVHGFTQVTYTLAPASWDWYEADLLIDGAWSTYTQQPGRAFTFDAEQLAPGTHHLRVRAFSSLDGEHTSPAVSVTVPTPTVTITSPVADADLSGSVDVTYTLTPASRHWSGVELYVDDAYAAGAAPNDPLSIDTSWFGPGSHTLRVRAYDGVDQWASANVAVTMS